MNGENESKFNRKFILIFTEQVDRFFLCLFFSFFHLSHISSFSPKKSSDRHHRLKLSKNSKSEDWKITSSYPISKLCDHFFRVSWIIQRKFPSSLLGLINVNKTIKKNFLLRYDRPMLMIKRCNLSFLHNFTIHTI